MIIEKRKINFTWIFTAVASAIFWFFAMFGVEYYHTITYEALKIPFICLYLFLAVLNVYFLALADLEAKTTYKMV